MPSWFLACVLCEVDWIRYHPEPVGTLSVAQVERDVPAMDALGNLCLPDEPRAGDAMVSGFSGEWQRWLRGPNRSYLLECGYRRDGLQEIVVLLDANQGMFEIRSGAYAHSTVFQQSILYQEAGVTIQDCLQGIRPGEAFVPKGLVVLPGCVVTLCERMLDVDMGPEVEWQSAGVSLVALQEDGFGQWHWEHLYDGPRLGGDDRALGILRGGPWCMSSYFPEGQSGEDLAGPDFTKAWIPFVDYMSQPDPHGGQCFLVQATRESRGDAWSFGETVMVRELLGDMHFHSAGWTPHGLLLSIGDTAEHNAVEWLRCADWERYDEPDQWMVERVQGDIRTDLGSAPAFQFWGVAPGATTNSLLLGGDINEGAVYEATMHHEMPPTFRRLAGTHPGGTSSLTHVVGVIRRPAPEVSTKVVLRSFHPADWSGSFGRIFASEDAVHFANLGQHPEGWSPKSHLTVRPSSGTILSVPWSSDSVKDAGLRALSGWRVAHQSTHGLRAEPGVLNLLGPTDGSWPLLSPGTEVEVEVGLPAQGSIDFSDGTSVRSVTPGPVLRMRREPGTSSPKLISFGVLREGQSLPAGTYALRCMVQSLGADPMTTRWSIRGQQDVLEVVQRRLTCADEWRAIVLPVEIESLEGESIVKIVIEDVDAGRGSIDLVVAPEQLVASNAPGVVSADTTEFSSSGETLIQSLGNSLGKSLTVVELGVPGGGLDVFLRQLGWKYEVGSFLNDRGESLRVQWDLLGGRVELTQTTQSFQFPLLGILDGHNWARESVMHLVLKQSSRGLNFSVFVGGNTVARGEWLSGVASESPLNQFVLSPDMPLDLRAAAVFPFDTPVEEALSWLVQAGSRDGLRPAGVSLRHDPKPDSVSAAGAPRR